MGNGASQPEGEEGRPTPRQQHAGGVAEEHRTAAAKVSAVSALVKAGGVKQQNNQQDQADQPEKDKEKQDTAAAKNQNNSPTSQNKKKTEEEEDEEEWQREKEKLAALKEKRERERKQKEEEEANKSKNTSTNEKDVPPAGSPEKKPEKKKKKLLNGNNIEYKYPSGSHYFGSFKDGKLHGFGKYHYHPSGDIYEGEWLADMKHGQGTYQYDGGDKYSGEWRAGKKHGKGTYSFTTGDEYVGNWKEDKIHGYGVFTIARNGNRYEGNWEESYRHGQGTLRSGNGDLYEGNWIRGKEEGLGVLTYANGNQYAGDWRGGQMDGKGIMQDKGQKYTVEHIAGYLIAKVAVDMDAQVDPDWNAANKLFKNYNSKKDGGDELAGSPSTGGDSAELVKVKIERDTFKKKYEDLLSKKGSNAEDDEDCDTNDVEQLKQKIVQLKEQRDVERQRADDLSTREKVLMTENQELVFKLKEFDELKRENEDLKKNGGGGAGNDAQLVSLQRRCAELEREVAARKAGTNSSNPEDPLELKVKLELAEGEIKVLRNASTDLQRAREQNREHQSTITQLELRNEELLKEMTVHRQRATNLQGQISDSHSKAAEEAQHEIRDLRNENRELMTARATLEEQLKKAKKKTQDYAERARQADELEIQISQLKKNTGSEAANAVSLGKNLDKKSDQVESLRKQNAELQRQLEEMQHDLEHGGSPAGKKDKKSKKDKKKKGGDDDEDAGNGADAAALAELQADYKKEKKKHKKAAQERDNLAMQVWTEQMKVVALQQQLDSVNAGRVLVHACVNNTKPTSKVFSINQDDPSQIDADVDGAVQNFNFDECFSADKDQNLFPDSGKKAVSTAITAGLSANFVALGQMGAGKTYNVNRQAPLIFDEAFRVATTSTLNDEAVSFDVSCVELSCGGATDLTNGSTSVRPMKDSNGRVVMVGAQTQTVSSSKDTRQLFEELQQKRTRQRSHVIFCLNVHTKHKIHNACRSGQIRIIDVAGQGSLGSQEDVDSAKFVNQSNVVLGRVIDALAAGSDAVPYRDDVLTEALSDTFGGNAITQVLLCLGLQKGAGSEDVHDAVNVIGMALKAQKIQNGPLLQAHESRELLRLRQVVAAHGGEEEAAQKYHEITSLRN